MQHRLVDCDEDRLRRKLDAVFEEHCPPMNRKERRTMKGKLLIAEAKLKVAEAELAHFKEFGWKND